MSVVVNLIKYLTPEEVVERYRGATTLGTLRNWRSMRVGPPYVKIGKAVLYPIDELDAWDKKKSCYAPLRSRNLIKKHGT